MTIAQYNARTGKGRPGAVEAQRPSKGSDSGRCHHEQCRLDHTAAGFRPVVSSKEYGNGRQHRIRL